MNKLSLFGLPFVLLLLLVPITTNLALASSSNEESEEEQQEQEQGQQEESEEGSGGGEVQQQSEECAVGPSTIKRIMGNESSPQFMDMYNDAVRTEEIKTYIAENVDKFLTGYTAPPAILQVPSAWLLEKWQTKRKHKVPDSKVRI